MSAAGSAASSAAATSSSSSSGSGFRLSDAEWEYLFSLMFTKKFAIFLIIVGFSTGMGIYLFT